MRVIYKLNDDICVGKTYIETKNRPIYIIKEEITNDKTKK